MFKDPWTSMCFWLCRLHEEETCLPAAVRAPQLLLPAPPARWILSTAPTRQCAIQVLCVSLRQIGWTRTDFCASLSVSLMLSKVSTAVYDLLQKKKKKKSILTQLKHKPASFYCAQVPRALLWQQWWHGQQVTSGVWWNLSLATWTYQRCSSLKEQHTGHHHLSDSVPLWLQALFPPPTSIQPAWWSAAGTALCTSLFSANAWIWNHSKEVSHSRWKTEREPNMSISPTEQPCCDGAETANTD